MATTDARPVPIKNTALHVGFPILDADGDLVTGAGSLDSEVSTDSGGFADCASESVEEATNSGMYELDLSAGEMNGDIVMVIVKSASGKTTPMVMYPQEAGDIKVDVQSISGDSTAADNAESFFDGTGYAGTGNVIPTVTTVNGLAANVITAAATAADFSTEVNTAVLAVLGALADAAADGAVTATDTLMAYVKQLINTLEGGPGIVAFPAAAAPGNAVSLAEIIRRIYDDLTLVLADTGTDGVVVNTHTAGGKAEINAEVKDVTDTDTSAESAGVVAATASITGRLAWLATLSRNKITQTATTQLLRNDADSGTIATSTVSDDGTTAIRGEFA